MALKLTKKKIHDLFGETESLLMAGNELKLKIVYFSIILRKLRNMIIG